MTNVEWAPPAANERPPSPFVIRHSEFYLPHTLQLDIHRHGRLPVETCLRISLALTNALDHLHGCGLVHRDIKPSNIIFVHGVPKLADIGLVASVDATLSLVAIWKGHSDAVRSVVFSHHDRLVLSGGEDGDVRLWDVAAQREAGRFHDGLRVSRLTLSPDGTALAGCGFENTVRLWRAKP
jgi:serine/threonine protein kinase